MIKCINCDKEAIYTCADPGVNPINYCAECLPTWQRERASLGHFPLIVPPSAKSKKKKDEVDAAEEEVPANEDN
jgi:hypothetical protein